MKIYRKALIVGINDYPQHRLYGCVSDAEKMNNLLERNEDGSLNFESILLTSTQRKITKPLLKQNIDSLFNCDPRIDIALLYFAGHGYVDSFGGHLVTQDYKEHDEGVSMDSVLSLANRSQARNKIIILDCCNAGNMGTQVNNPSRLSELANGVTILTSSQILEPSEEDKKGGLFSSLLFEGLGGTCSDLMGNVSPGSLYAFIDQSLGAWGQRPVFKTNVSEFVSLRKVSPPIKLSILQRITGYFQSADSEFRLNPTFEFTESCHTEGNVKILKDLQKMESVGLVKPVGEEHMYFAAMNSESCKLTALGGMYWKLVKTGKI